MGRIKKNTKGVRNRYGDKIVFHDKYGNSDGVLANDSEWYCEDAEHEIMMNGEGII